MSIMNVFENAQYLPNFIEKQQANIYFTQLRTLPFYIPTFRTRGKCVKPKRLVLGFGDANLNYNFSRNNVPAEPWTPLMLELRDRVEKFDACSFNYVLLNLYVDGSSHISQHKCEENGLDTDFPIVVLSFGAGRTIEIKKLNTPSTFIKLEHGSLFAMLKPTNELLTHEIAPDPNVKDMTITLTFCHLQTNPVYSPMKKPRLQICDTSPVKNSLPPTASKKECSPTNNYEKDCFTVNSCEKDFFPKNSLLSKESSKDLCDENDLLTTLFHQKGVIYPVLKQWNLNRNTILKIVLDCNLNLRIHIRRFYEPNSGELIPTKQGIIMTTTTWIYFIGKIQNFKFHSVNDSIICNNQLLVAYIDKEFCMLQQIYPLNCPGFFLKPDVLKLFKDQIVKLLEITAEITETIIETIFTIQLPKLILSQPSVCFSHLNVKNARQNFFKCISSEIISCTNMIECEDCFYMLSDKSKHACAKPILERFNLNKRVVLLSLNLFNIIKNLRSGCMCHYDSLFFQEFNIKLYEKSIEEILADM